MSSNTALVPEMLVQRIHFVCVGTKSCWMPTWPCCTKLKPEYLVQAVKRNLRRFPSDFMFQLTDEEWAVLRSQNMISKGRGVHQTQSFQSLKPDAAQGFSPYFAH